MAWRLLHVLRLLCLSNTAVAVTVTAGQPLFVPHSPRPRRRHSSSFRHRRQVPSMLFQQLSEESESGGVAHVFLRFSPLIGGPAFLPLHVEVIVAVEDAKSEKIKHKMDTIYIRRVNKPSSTSFLKEQLELHRFDFLPKKPADPRTLVQLMTLKGVPGRVRHRIYEGSVVKPTNVNDDDESTGNQDGSGITILVPIGSLTDDDDKEVTAKEVVSTAINFREEYRDTLYKELQILGGKNCLSFALDLLSHVEVTTGMQRIPRLNKLDIE